MMKPASTAPTEPRRKRPRTTQPIGSQTDLPEIPGVPPDLTPLLVQSLRSATKFFQHSTTIESQSASFSSSQILQQQSSLVDSILNRMELSEEDTTRRKRKERMEEDHQSWLEAVKRRAGGRETNHHQQSVPLSCFRYLWNLGQDHSRIPVRRASLYLCASLLQKSSDCRLYVATDDNLLKWVTCVVDGQKLGAAEQQVSCWQSEARACLSHLSEKYGDLYPKFCVAFLFLEQRCTFSRDTSPSDTNNNAITMPDLRRLRDIAMKYGDREIEKVEKLIKRAHACLDVLVPRMGASPETAIASVPSTRSVIEEDEEDDDIEWEDGDEESNEEVIDHAEAVERTLAEMVSAGGLQGGNLEINLVGKEDEEDSHEATDEKTRKILQKAVNAMESRHMKRLSSWVDALIKADGLVLNGGSLVVMPVDMARKRSQLLEQLLGVKRSLASILASASRLEINVSSIATAEEGQRHQPSVVSNIPPPRQMAVLATAARRRVDHKVARRRSTKLQIKYRTS